MTPDDQVRNNFTFISEKGNKCFVEFTDNPETALVINLDNPKERTETSWKKAIAILDSKQSIKRVKEKKKPFRTRLIFE